MPLSLAAGAYFFFWILSPVGIYEGIHRGKAKILFGKEEALHGKAQ